MLQAILAFHLRKIDALLPTMFEMEIKTDQIGIIRANAVQVADVGSDLFKTLHGTLRGIVSTHASSNRPRGRGKLHPQSNQRKPCRSLNTHPFMPSFCEFRADP
jgi:hypothetical protein